MPQYQNHSDSGVCDDQPIDDSRSSTKLGVGHANADPAAAINGNDPDNANHASVGLATTGASAHGPDRVLFALYGLFSIAATGRSIYQLIVRPEPAMLAYLLSALAAVVYLVGLVLLIRANHHHKTRPAAAAWCLAEFAGVIVVGFWTLLERSHFPAPTVWSDFGSGYGFLPAVLPLAALWWLRVTSGRSLDTGRPAHVDERNP